MGCFKCGATGPCAPLTNQPITFKSAGDMTLEPAPKITDPHLLIALALAFAFHGGLFTLYPWSDL